MLRWNLEKIRNWQSLCLTREGGKVITVLEQMKALAGRHRRRVLGPNDLFQALAEARRTGVGVQAGETVANNYSFPASRMRLLAVKAGDRYGILMDWGSARKGATPVPIPGGLRSKMGKAILAAAQQGELLSEYREVVDYRREPIIHRFNWLVVSASEVNRSLARWRCEARRRRWEAWPEEPDSALQVTVADSLAAGNCRAETERVAGWWPAGTESVSAAELRQAILEREPTLAEYAKRAIKAARQRQQEEECR